MSFQFTPRPMVSLKKRLLPLYSAPDRRQWILFANSRKELETDHLKTREFLDVKSLPGDILMINGPMFREQKFFYTNLFLNPELIDLSTLLRNDDADATLPADPDAIAFDAIGCLATRSLGSAGWDGDRVRLVFSVDFPTDLCSSSQEKGRAGRWDGAGPETDEYFVCASLNSFLYLLKRIHREERDKDFAASDKILPLKEYRQMLIDDLLAVVKMYVLPIECFHCYLARRLANPFMKDYNMSVPLAACGNACDYCLRNNGDVTANKAFPSVVRLGLKRVLLDLFIGERRVLNPTIDDDFTKVVQRYPSIQRIVFASKSKKVPEKMKIEQLLLMLLVSSILTFQVQFDDDDEKHKNPKIVARLNIDVDGELCVTQDVHWIGIPLKDALL
jgi:hypothetical protein